MWCVVCVVFGGSYCMCCVIVCFHTYNPLLLPHVLLSFPLTFCSFCSSVPPHLPPSPFLHIALLPPSTHKHKTHTNTHGRCRRKSMARALSQIQISNESASIQMEDAGKEKELFKRGGVGHIIVPALMIPVDVINDRYVSKLFT